MSRTPSPKYQVQTALKPMLCIGKSKAEAKANGTASEGIYAWSTYHTYVSACTVFLEWTRENYGCKLLENAEVYIEDYIKSRIASGVSAWTVARDISALCKIYQIKRDDIKVKTPPRRRRDITRSRGEKAHDKEFSEAKNKDAVDFGKGTGARIHEMARARGGDVYVQNGEVMMHIKGKGGKIRESVVRPEYREHVLNCASRVGKNEFIFPKGTLKNRMDEHSYRREYAQAIYDARVRDLGSLDRKEKYYCRGDKKGVVYDREAMLYTSQQLGHERIDVIAGHYL